MKDEKLSGEEIVPDFQQHLAEELKIFKEDLEKPGIVSYGPSFYIPTSSGNLLLIRTLIDDNPENLVGKIITIVAEDEKERAVGFKTQSFQKVTQHSAIAGASAGEIYSSGQVETGVRKQGVAMALELIMELLIQNEANQRGTKVLWDLKNHNLEELHGLKGDLKRQKAGNADTTAIDKLESQITEKEKEQQSWQAIYSKLGFDTNSNVQRKYFEPEQKDDLLRTKGVYLKRDEKGKVEIEKREGSITDPYSQKEIEYVLSRTNFNE